MFLKFYHYERSKRSGAVALHSYFFPKLSASGFQSFGKQILRVDRSRAAFYMHCLSCWVVGRHLQVFWEINRFAMFFSWLSVYKGSNCAIAISFSRKTLNVCLSLLLVYKDSNCAIAICFSRKKL